MSYRCFVQLIDAAERLSEAAHKSHNREAGDMALAFSLYGSIMAEKDSMIEQMAAEASARLSGQDRTIASAWLNVALAEYSINDRDYSKATGYALDALEKGKALNNNDLTIVALSQLARIYNNKEDKTGIKRLFKNKR